VAGRKPTLLINVPYRMLRERIEDVTPLGIGVEVYLDNEAVGEVDPQDAGRLGAELRERGITCTVHAPYIDLSPGGVDRDVRRVTLEKLKRAIGTASLMGARGIVCHGAYDRWRFGGHEQVWLDNSIETWTELLRESGDLPLLIENVFEETPRTIFALLDRFREKNLWWCFDTGHFNLFSKEPLDAWLMPCRERLLEFHIHDNHGGSDEHLPVGRGAFPFHELKRMLGKMNNALFFTAETPSEESAVESLRSAKEFLS
jgi:sugar phosphate isomerase/epimerase